MVETGDFVADDHDIRGIGIGGLTIQPCQNPAVGVFDREKEEEEEKEEM